MKTSYRGQTNLHCMYVSQQFNDFCHDAGERAFEPTTMFVILCTFKSPSCNNKNNLYSLHENMYIKHIKIYKKQACNYTEKYNDYKCI